MSGIAASKRLIYFCGSMRAGRQDVDLYGTLVEKLSRYGEVLTPFVADKNLTNLASKYEDGDVAIHDRCVERLRQCHVVVAEVTVASLGVGYEIGRAVAMGKNVLCLYRPQEGQLLSAMIRGMDNGAGLRVFDYKPEEVDSIFDEFLNSS
eukprot:TRINITY_DN16114_c0_g1_i1.p1 TRINITY_DN16114_c0_g1~~TRINITY_DN16114_c0_g1_i1.p1  ORF type:complete len:150 (-),score=29.65 TRINITY_DN16114_c0_g1_i1:50-499(-)